MPDPSETRPSDPGQIIDDLCDQLEDGWRAGSPPAIADLLAFAAEPIRPTLFRQLLPIDLEYRAKVGRPLSAEEARTQYGGLGPWAAEIIKGQLAATTTDWPSGGDTPSDGHFSVALDPSAEPLPAQIGKFRVIRRLGGGGMGVVYLARDPDGHNDVAVKVMRPKYAADPVARERFLREARSAMIVRDHDHIVPVYQVEENGGSPFLVMPVLKGESLEERLNREKLPPLELVLQVGREVALGLAAAHDKGLVHRDVKPGNIWLEGDPVSPYLVEQVRRVKVLDFGLARAVDHTDGVSVTGSIVGTPQYMAPEQARGEQVDGRADLFSLGAVLYRMSAGRPAFTGPTLTAVLTAIATQTPLPPDRLNPAVPSDISALIMRLLSKDPGRRPATAEEVGRELYAGGPGTRHMPPPRSRRRLAGVLVPVLVLTLVAAGLAWGLRVKQGSPESPPSATKGTEPSAPTVTPLNVSVTMRAWKKRDTARSLALDQEGALPLQPGDLVRLEIQASRLAYLYVIYVDASGEAAPIYPWRKYGWNDRAPETATAALQLPEDPLKDAAPLTPGPAGIEAVLVLARTEPLTSEQHAALATRFAGKVVRQENRLSLLKSVAWVSATEAKRFASAEDRGRPELAQSLQVDDPVEQIRRLLQTEVKNGFADARAVCYPFDGQ